MHDRLDDAVKKVLPGVRADLGALVRIRSVSADPAAAGEVRRSAELTARLLREAGMPEVAVVDDVPGMRPAVLAHCPPPPGMPTVLLYAHHDVQPAGAIEDWTTPPFEPVERDGRLYGRGTADDKAGIAAHLAVIRAFGGRPPVGVTVFVEGEEEVGSPTLAAFLERHHAELAADVIVLADGDNFATGVPAFTTTLRGIASCVVEVGALRRAVHSGSYGGAAPDALTALCRLLSTLHDERGEVAVAGLRGGTIAGVSYPVDRFRAEAGLLDGVELVGTGTLAERLWAKPAVTVLGIDAPAVEDASNALQATARAKIGIRVAPGDDAVSAAAALAEHLRGHAPWGVRVSVTGGETGQPHVIDASGPAYRAAREAWREAYGVEVADIGGGGAIPFVADFARAFPAAAVLVTSAGGDPLANPHTVDENLHLGDFARTCLAEALFLARLDF